MITPERAAAIVAHEEPDLITLLIEREAFNEYDAREGFIQLKMWLVACWILGGKFPPGERMDQVWHQFILMTRAYADFCRDSFGSFIHHEPTIPGAERAAPPKRDKTPFQVARELFGNTVKPAFWPMPGKGGDCSCGGYCDLDAERPATDPSN